MTLIFDYVNSSLNGLRVENRSSDPTPGNAGRLFWNTTDSALRVDTGSIIATMATGGTISGLNAGRIPFASNATTLVDDPDLSFSGDTLTATKLVTTQITNSGLFSGRVPFASTGGLLVDDADLTFLTDTLTATKLSTTKITAAIGGSTSATILSVTSTSTSNLLDIATITGGSLFNQKALAVTGSFVNTSGAQIGSSIAITTASGTSGATKALDVSLVNSGFGGSGLTIAVDAANPLSGSGSGLGIGGSTLSANVGVRGAAAGAGAVIGVFGSGAGSAVARNIGVFGDGNGTAGAASSIGVWGNAHPTNGTVRVAGYFGLHTAEPSLINAALICDNGSAGTDIFVARDSGTTAGTKVFSILGGGQVSTFADNGFLLHNFAGRQGLLLRIMTVLTDTAVQREMSLDGDFIGAGPGTSFLTLPVDAVHSYVIYITARDAGTAGAMFKIEALAKRFSGTVSTVGVTATTLYTDNINWSVTAVADNVNKRLAVKVTGSATSIRWVAHVHETVI